jgi:hypothetical protein
MTRVSVCVALLGVALTLNAGEWFYGHPAPTVTGAEALKDWHKCIDDATAKLDDGISSVGDVAAAIQPMCESKETLMIDAVNKEYIDKNEGVGRYLGVQQMEKIRSDAHESSRQTIGTTILKLRSQRR